MWEIPFSFVFLDFTSTCGDSLFVIQKAKLLHMNSVVIAPWAVVFPWKSDRYARHILGYKVLILVLFRVFWKVLCRNEILVFFVCSFSMSNKNEKFPKSFLVSFRILCEQFGYFLEFSKNVPDEHTYHFCIKRPPRILAFTPGKSLRRKDNNYLEKFDTC